MIDKKRCNWAIGQLNITYHDTEWGVLQTDDKILFEFLILEGAQAGLSWTTILKRRENYRDAFAGFDPIKVADFTDNTILKLLDNSGIIRNRLKISATVNNAKKFIAVQQEFGSFYTYIWRFVNNSQVVHSYKNTGDIPPYIPQAQTLSNDLKKREFSFVGPTICYAFMQAVGMVNDHILSCFRYTQV